jgi:uncharacterized membrane protein
MIDPLTHVVDAWSSLYSGSWAIRSSVNFAHIGALVGAGGCAIASDRATLIASRQSREDRVRHLAALHAVHRTIVAGLVVVVISGVLLMLADLDSYLHATVFWLKLGGVVALTINGARLVNTGRRASANDDAAWAALRGAAVASLVLWFTTTLLGAVLPNVL